MRAHATRVRWTVLVVLLAAGCVSSEAWDFDSPAPEPRRSDPRWEVREGLERAEELPPPGERTGNVTMVVEKVLFDRRDRVNLEVAWRYVDPNVAAGGGSVARRNGLRVGVATDGFRAAFSAALNESRTYRVVKTFITSLTGTKGTITVGRQIYVPRLRFWTPRGHAVLLEDEFVGASLVSIPEILPDDRVRVKLYPAFSTREGRTIELTEMTTEVITRHGQPLVIGGSDESSESVGAALFSWTRERESRRVVLTVTPYIQGAP